MNDFNVVNGNNEFRLGTMMAIFKLPDIDREFALFTVGDYDGDDNSLHVSYIDKGSDGYDHLSEIEDERVLGKAMEAVREIIIKLNDKSIS